MDTQNQKCKCCGRELPIEKFKTTRWGTRTRVCHDCDLEHRQANREARRYSARQLALQDYTPRELMEELARRGYEGKLTYTHIETIDIANF